VRIPTITSRKPLLGKHQTNNNQACNRFLSGNFSWILDNTLDGVTKLRVGDFWNLIDAPNGEVDKYKMGDNRMSYLK